MSSNQRSTPLTFKWVTSLTLDLLKGCQMTLCVDHTSLSSVQNGVLGHHFASTRLLETIAEAQIYQLVISSTKVRYASRSMGDTTVAAVSGPLRMTVPPTSTSTMFSSSPMPTPHINPMLTVSAAPMPSGMTEPMNVVTIAIGER